MKNLVLALSLAALAPLAAPVTAQLVTPSLTTGQYHIVLANGNSPATSVSQIREGQGVDAFSSSASSGNFPHGAAGFTNEIFLTTNAVSINYLRLRGNASSLAQPGAAALLQQSTTSVAGRAEFDVATEIRYDLTGSLTTSGIITAGPGGAVAVSGLQLLRNNVPYSINTSRNVLADGSTPLNFSGTLLPGHYTLECYTTTAASASQASSHWAAATSYDARMDFFAIPAPATLALFPLALIARRRR